MKKYKVIYQGNIATRIAIEIDVKGYTEGVLEPFFPEFDEMTPTEKHLWVVENNRFIKRVCQLLNEDERRQG